MAELSIRALGAGVSDAAFCKAVIGAPRSATEAARSVEASISTPLFSWAEREELLAVLLIDPEVRAAVHDRASAALAGEFDILGSGLIRIGVHPDWARDFRSGLSWPSLIHRRRVRVVRLDGSDVKVPWELSRLQHLPAIGYEYLLSGDEKYGHYFESQVSDWIAKNPLELGVNWTCTMDVAMRATSLAWSYSMLRRSQVLSTEFRVAFIRSMLEHGRFIAANLEDGGSVSANHLVADLSGLAFLAQTFPGFKESDRWLSTAITGLEREMEAQVLPDGSDFEASTSYHRLVLELFVLPALLLRKNGRELSTRFWSSLRQMFVFDAAIQNSAGWVPQFGDNDSGRGYRLINGPDLDHSELNGLGAAIFQDAELNGGRPPSAGVAMLVGSRAFSVVGRGGGRLPSTVHLLHAGIVVLRRGAIELFVRCGGHGQRGVGGHGHNDALSFELSIKGTRVVVDPGTGVYTSDPSLRNEFRGTKAHSSLCIDGAEQSKVSPTNLFVLRDELELTATLTEKALLCPELTCTARSSTHLHQRQFRLDLDDAVIIEDRVTPSADLEMRLTVLPTTRVVVNGTGATLMTEGGHTSRVRFNSPAGVMVDVVEGKYSPGYGLVTPTQVLRVRTSSAKLVTQWDTSPDPVPTPKPLAGPPQS